MISLDIQYQFFVIFSIQISILMQNLRRLYTFTVSFLQMILLIIQLILMFNMRVAVPDAADQASTRLMQTVFLQSILTYTQLRQEVRTAVVWVSLLVSYWAFSFGVVEVPCGGVLLGALSWTETFLTFDQMVWDQF